MRAVENTAKLLEVARRYDVPVASCSTAYMNEREMPYWKITAVRDTFREDHPSSALDPRIHDPSYDLTVCKKAPSIFFETGVSAYFVKERVDTVIVTGCNTSGCIRATSAGATSMSSTSRPASPSWTNGARRTRIRLTQSQCPLVPGACDEHAGRVSRQ